MMKISDIPTTRELSNLILYFPGAQSERFDPWLHLWDSPQNCNWATSDQVAASKIFGNSKSIEGNRCLSVWWRNRFLFNRSPARKPPPPPSTWSGSHLRATRGSRLSTLWSCPETQRLAVSYKCFQRVCPSRWKERWLSNTSLTSPWAASAWQESPPPLSSTSPSSPSASLRRSRQSQIRKAWSFKPYQVRIIFIISCRIFISDPPTNLTLENRYPNSFTVKWEAPPTINNTHRWEKKQTRLFYLTTCVLRENLKLTLM